MPGRQYYGLEGEILKESEKKMHSHNWFSKPQLKLSNIVTAKKKTK